MEIDCEFKNVGDILSSRAKCDTPALTAGVGTGGDLPTDQEIATVV
jgi:hypothetical protein